VVATALGLVAAGRPTIWYDEAVTLNLLHRPFGDTWTVLREVDAVHGLYYVVLRGWTTVTGDSIEAVRAFSALGVGVAAAATVLLVARHQRLRIALAAGLVTGITPGLAWTALDGRSYAWSAAFAVLATLALDNACRNRKRPRDWFVYGAVCAVACTWHLYLALLVVGHGISVMVGFPKGRIPWTLTAIVTAIASVPLGVIAWRQRDQVRWLNDITYSWDRMVLNQLTSGQPADPDWVRVAVLALLLVLSVLGVWRLWKQGRRWLPATLALWGGLPTAVAVGCAFADTGMHPRYVTFAVPAYSIAATIGAFAVPRLIKTRRVPKYARPSLWTRLVQATPAVVGVVALAAIVPVLVAQRGADAKPDNLRRIAATAEDEDADAVYFTVAKARGIEAAYPGPFEDYPDVSAPLDTEGKPFFPGVRDPETVKGVDVAGLRILVYGTRNKRSADRLRELGCRSEPVTHDRHFVVTLYTCPEITRAVR
jgi:mannosyltransferase